MDLFKDEGAGKEAMIQELEEDRPKEKVTMKKMSNEEFDFPQVTGEAEEDNPFHYVQKKGLERRRSSFAGSGFEKLASNAKTGPLNRPDLYWAVSKTGQGTKTSYSVVPVKERDLAEEWEIDPIAAAELIKTMKPLGPDALHTSTKAELVEIAREIASGN